MPNGSQKVPTPNTELVAQFIFVTNYMDMPVPWHFLFTMKLCAER
jgi:hypothetical protein